MFRRASTHPTHRFLALVAALVAATVMAAACGSTVPLEQTTPPEQATPISARSTGDAPIRTAGSQIGDFRRKRAMNHVSAIADDIGVRVRGSQNEEKAALYFKAEMDRLGYETRMRSFKVDGNATSYNVTATWPGAIRYPFIVGGHLDTVPKSPGANDNASGLAVILEAARLLKGKKQAKYLKFVAFGSEEYGPDGRHHVGSQVFVNRLGSKGKKRTPGMISVDMVADGKPLIIATTEYGPDVVAKTIHRKIKRARINTVYRVMCDCSDNGPFERSNIPGSFMWSGTEPDYHSPSDTSPNLKPKHLARSGKALMAFLVDVKPKMLKRFRSSR